MIVLFGISSDPILGAMAASLARCGAVFRLVDQRDDEVTFCSGDSRSPTRLDGERVGSVVLRPSAIADVCDAENWDPSGAEATRSAIFTSEFLAHCEFEPWLVVNRLSVQASNLSKPWQMERILPWFDVPRTLVTTDPECARAFVDSCRRTIVKSVSAVRSIVREIDAERSLMAVAHCPTMFQERIDGTDIRVHVVGRAVFATEMTSEADDYRYDCTTSRSAIELPDDVAHRCVRLSEALGLQLSGVDLRRTPDGRWVCFEVNPSPAFTYFEPWPQTPIADALAMLLLANE